MRRHPLAVRAALLLALSRTGPYPSMSGNWQYVERRGARAVLVAGGRR